MNASAALLSALPHRPPFLFVDEVIEIEDKRIVTKTYVDPAADFFRGHYPGRPVMPGVLLCECCFQAGALLIVHHKGGWDWSDGTPVLARIGDARFKQMVLPGQTIFAEVTLDDELDRAYVMSARVTVDAKVAMLVTFSCMLARGKEDGR